MWCWNLGVGGAGRIDVRMRDDAGDRKINGKKKHATPKKKMAGSDPDGKPVGKEIGEESLARWAEEDAEALSLLVSLIPAQHYAAAELLANNVPSKYVKKAGGTESKKVALANKKARKRAKFDADGGEKGDDSDSDEEGGTARDGEKESEDDVGNDKVGRRFGNSERVANVAELHARLQAKKAQLRGNRPEVSEEEAAAKKAKREKLKEKERKGKEKDKAKSASVPIPSPMPKLDSRGGDRPAEPKDDGSFTFGRIKIGGEDVVGGGKHKDKKYRDRPEKLLENLEAKKRKLEELGPDTEEGKRFKERQLWGATIDRAQGVKVKDDEKLLKKTISKKNKLKVLPAANPP